MSQSTLARSLSVAQLFALALGTIIGVGWIITLGSLFELAGSLGTLLAFVIGAHVMLVVALSYMEVANLYPATGGEVAYNAAIFNLPMAFIAGWFMALAYTATAAFEAVAGGWLLGVLFPSLRGPTLYRVLDSDVRLGELVMGMALMAVFGVLNHLRASVAAAAQEWMTWGLLALTGAFVALCLFAGDLDNARPLFPAEAGAVGFWSVLAVTPFFYIGFNVLPQALGERAPGMSPRAINRALVGSVVVALIFYVAVVVAAAVVAPRAQLLGAELPVAAAFGAAFDSEWAARLVIVAGLLGLLSTWNAVYFAAARVLYAFGRAGVISPWFGRADAMRGTPGNAILVVGVLGAIGAAFGQGAIMPIVNATSAVMMLVLASVCFGLVRSRWTAPTLARPYRLPHGTLWGWIGGLLSVGMSGLALYQARVASPDHLPPEWLVIGIWCAVGAALYAAAVRSRRTAAADRVGMSFE